MLIDQLALRAASDGRREAFAFQGRSTSYSKLWESIRGYACWLSGKGIGKSEPVLLALPNGPAFFRAFYGLQLSGAIPVPLFPSSGIERMQKLAGKIGAGRAIVAQDFADSPGGNIQLLPDTVPDGDRRTSSPLPGPDDLAFIQFTSGSSGEPKGVQITQHGLLTNIQQMVDRMGFTQDDVFASWLPVYHDMGLILMTGVPFYLGCRLELLPARLNGLRTWIRTISDRRATFTAAPDFAYRLALAYISDPGSYDLRSLRAALSGAEQVRFETAQAFESAFGLVNVLTAGYGLAEATVGVCMTKPGRGLRTDERGLVSVGQPLDGIDLAILGEDGQLLGASQHGEVLVRGPGNTPGYFNDPDGSASLFWGEGFMRTGDLGYLDSSGELFILARKKNIIKQAGRTLAPQEIESLVDRHPQVRQCAAVGIDLGNPEGEQAYVFAELRSRRDLGSGMYHDILVSLVDSIHQGLGFRPGRVMLVRPGAIPRTPNGKLQRQLLRDKFLLGEMSDELLYP